MIEMIEINLQKLERGLRREKVKVTRNGKVTYDEVIQQFNQGYFKTSIIDKGVEQ